MMNQTKSILMWGKKDDDEDGDDDLFGGLVVWMVWMICLFEYGQEQCHYAIRIHGLDW